MYDLPLSMGLIPDLTAQGAAVASALTVLIGAWLAVATIVFLVAVPLAARRLEASGVSDAERWDADLRRAA